MDNNSIEKSWDYLCHFGILGMKWGIRRYQNPDGSLTPEGRIRYGVSSSWSDSEAVTAGKLDAKRFASIKGSPTQISSRMEVIADRFQNPVYKAAFTESISKNKKLAKEYEKLLGKQTKDLAKELVKSSKEQQSDQKKQDKEVKREQEKRQKEIQQDQEKRKREAEKQQKEIQKEQDERAKKIQNDLDKIEAYKKDGHKVSLSKMSDSEVNDLINRKLLDSKFDSTFYPVKEKKPGETTKRVSDFLQTVSKGILIGTSMITLITALQKFKGGKSDRAYEEYKRRREDEKFRRENTWWDKPSPWA